MADDSEPTLGAVVLGLDGFELIQAREVGGEVWLYAQTTAARTGCAGCGAVATLHDRRHSVVRDPPVGGRAARLVWDKRVWRCDENLCGVRTWTERHPAILPRASLTERARAEICRQVGKLGRPVAALAREYGIGWQTAMNAVTDHGRPLVDAADRVDGVTALGVDETAFLKANRDHHTVYVTGLVDLRAGRLLDVVADRTAKAVTGWLDERTLPWPSAVETVALDPHRGYYNAMTAGLPAAAVVVDCFHAVKLANTCVDQVRRRVQHTTTGHRGRRSDPLYRIRRLLLTAAERLSERGWQRLEAGWDAADPDHEVSTAWTVKEALRDVYRAGSVHDAQAALDDFYRWARDAQIPECDRLAATIRQWEPQILAYHTTGGVSNGPTEAANLLIKKIKRVGHGFRNFDNYRLRLLLHCGVTWQDQPTARIRGRAPRSAA